MFSKGFAILAAGLVLTGNVLSAEPTVAKGSTFSSLQAPSVETARSQAQEWLKAAGKTDAATLKSFESIWSSERPVLNCVADTLALGDAAAAKLLTEARDPTFPAPKEVPALLKDAGKPAYFRSNLTLAYARGLSTRRVYEEALEALKLVKPEQVVDPSAYFFHKAVSEHALLLKEDANRSIVRLLDDVTDAPDRYKLVATLMYFDMQQWQEKDLGKIARLMDNVERRLELARGGPKTQKTQKEIIARLDELIKKLENQQKQQQQQGGGGGGGGGQQPGGQEPGCPSGGEGSQDGPSTNQPSKPADVSRIMTNSGPGHIDEKTLKQLADVWGKLPEGERTKAMAELTRGMPPRYRDVIENYFKKLAQNPAQP